MGKAATGNDELAGDVTKTADVPDELAARDAGDLRGGQPGALRGIARVESILLADGGQLLP